MPTWEEYRAKYAELGSINAVARHFDVHRATVQEAVPPEARGNRQERSQAPVAEAQEAPVTPRERFNADFWKRKAQEAQRHIDVLEHVLAEVSGVKTVNLEPPIWTSARHADSGGRSIVIAHTSDLHMGERIEPGEIDGINKYDPDIARERMRRYFDAACTIPLRWMADQTCDGILLTMAGDLIAGDIHEDLRRTNALTATESVAAVAEVYVAGIRQLLTCYVAVHVVAVPGNHGRTTDRPPTKMVSRLSYDMLAAQMVRERLADDPRVTWTMASGVDARVPIYGRTLVVTHGDRYAKGGQGMTGPGLPMLRGAARVKAQSAAADLACDLLLIGHFHMSAQPPGVLANGSVVGYSEYAYGERFAVDPPQQWLARFSMKWGLCDRLSVRLDEPVVRMRAKGFAT